jgi:hypothetical protein
VSLEFSDADQGTDAWLASRLGYITASRIRDVRDRLKGGGFSARATLYAQDIARERCGGQPERPFETWAMRQGKEAEEAALLAYVEKQRATVVLSGFAFDRDRLYGCSPDAIVVHDGLGDTDGMAEVKTLVGSSSLFKVLVDGDISGYMDQIQFSLYLLEREWCDLVLWTPDFGLAAIRRIPMDPDYISAMLADIATFEVMVDANVSAIEAALDDKERK